MRKLIRLLWCAFALTCSMPAVAQDQTITGTVKDPTDNSTLTGATIFNKRSHKSVVSNEQGKNTLAVRTGDVLVISHIGRKTVQLTVGAASSYESTLEIAGSDMGEAVVTAMDIRRNSRELGYSVAKVTGKEIQQSQRHNCINSLQGWVAGLTINPTSGSAGASSQIILRGFNSASLSNQPLFVVDGVIIDNSTFNETSNGGSGIGLASDRPNRNNDYTNRSSDINPSDIESITVLKGPEATALYGSQASSGAIVITTKKPGNTGKLNVSYDNSFRGTKETRFAPVINNYSPGLQCTPSSTTFTYFGPAYPADAKMYDNRDNFFKTGFTQSHNLGLDFGRKNVGFRLSGSWLNEDGVIPNNNFKRGSIRLTNTTKISNMLTITPSVSYVHTDNAKPLRGPGGYLLDLYAWPTTDNAQNYFAKTGHKHRPYAITPNSEGIDNPFFSVNKNHSRDVTDRWIASLGIDLHPLPWLDLAGRFGYDTYKTNGYSFYHPETVLLT